MRTIPREVYRSSDRDDPVETTRRLLSGTTQSQLELYLIGALHDATFNRFHQTFRFSQSSEQWLKLLKAILKSLGHNGWIYREGMKRSVWVLETAIKLNPRRKPNNIKEKIFYIRGYFDAEGGMPRNNRHWLYFQFSQKNLEDLTEVRNYLEEVGVSCGKIHNPSKRVDKEYWRFFISRASHKMFMNKINSWHPRKKRQMKLRMKI